MCLPVNITLSWTSLYVRFTTLLKRNALPVAPVKRVLISSERFVKLVSHVAQENKRLPPMCSKNIRPIVSYKFFVVYVLSYLLLAVTYKWVLYVQLNKTKCIQICTTCWRSYYKKGNFSCFYCWSADCQRFLCNNRNESSNKNVICVKLAIKIKFWAINHLWSFRVHLLYEQLILEIFYFSKMLCSIVQYKFLLNKNTLLNTATFTSVFIQRS